ncbi:hypothetical protein [Streptomyces sp. NPDC057381]|uniref:hypothetical protein n=1 Tax=Streptomyces sp. NPDC057381 TaxID=3346111 RepID=UPI003638592E
MINPSGIPQFTGDFDQLDKDASGLRSDAIGIRNGGTDVHSRFQMLEAFYTAPEAETLFATTQPVMDKADAFAAKLETVADALDTFSIEARPLAKRLDQLKADAIAFVSSVEGDDDWTDDEDKVDENRRLVDDVTAAQAAFREAERRAATKISTLVGGPTFVAENGSGFYRLDTVRYGYTTELMEGAEDLPWGAADDRTYEEWTWGWFGHGAKSFFWDGIYKDGIEAGVKGLWSLATGDEETWRGLTDAVTGIGLYTMTPYDAFMDWAIGPDEESEDEVRAKEAAKDFGKALVAWDMWQENPARASGTVIFNVLTLGAGPLATASKASKGGTAGKTAGVAAKAGMYMDPVYVGLRASGTAVSKLPKLSEVTSRVTGATGAVPDGRRVDSAIELEDGSKVVITNGEFIAYDKHGKEMTELVREELPPVVSDKVEQADVPVRELVGAASRGPEASAGFGRESDGPPAATEGHPRIDGDGGAARATAPTESSAPGNGAAGDGTGHGGDQRRGTVLAGGSHEHAGYADGASVDSGVDSAGGADGVSGGTSDNGVRPGPVELGGETERRLREGIRGIPRNTIKPKVVEKIVSRLGKDTAGQEMADIIASGHLSRMPGYKDVVAMLGSGIESHFPSAVDQLRLAEQFHRSGVRNIEFEIKNSSIKADIDVKVTDDSGTSYGYQMKRLRNPKNPFESIAKADNLGQLSKSEADHKVMLVDGQGPIAEWEARGTLNELMQVHRGDHPVKSEKGRGILFVLRLDDGTVVIPPGSKVDPRGVL